MNPFNRSSLETLNKLIYLFYKLKIEERVDDTTLPGYACYSEELRLFVISFARRGDIFETSG